MLNNRGLLLFTIMALELSVLLMMGSTMVYTIHISELYYTIVRIRYALHISNSR